jgi:hypothetical protein
MIEKIARLIAFLCLGLVAEAPAQGLELSISPTEAVMSNMENCAFTVTLKNTGCDSVLLYSFFNQWVDIDIEQYEPEGYEPGEKTGEWVPGFNVMLRDSIGRLRGDMSPFPQPESPESYQNFLREQRARVEASGVFVRRGDSIRTQLDIDFSRHGVLPGTYTMHLYYVLNDLLLEYFRPHSGFHSLRLKSNSVRITIRQ